LLFTKERGTDTMENAMRGTQGRNSAMEKTSVWAASGKKMTVPEKNDLGKIEKGQNRG